MKKMRYFGFILSLLAMFVSVAANPMDGKAIELLEVRNDADGGVIFVFHVEGKFTRSELEGWVDVQGGDSYKIYCNQVSADTVQCSTSRKTGDHNVMLTFGGATFWDKVPEKISSGSSGCSGLTYHAYDWNDYFLSDSTYWNSFFDFCSDTVPNDGDILSSNEWSKLWNETTYYDYKYYSNGVDNAYCGWANAGPGFYYDDNYACPN